MKALTALLFLLLSDIGSGKNTPVSKVDLHRYSGTWYSLYSIPTMFDKGSRETTTIYTFNKEGYLDVKTTCRKPDNGIRTMSSKLFPSTDIASGELKAQFIWPIKIDYWIIELADDYSYVVVGHPDKKFLFIMSRSKKMPARQYQEIVDRCKAKGYDVSKLSSQKHQG